MKKKAKQRKPVPLILFILAIALVSLAEIALILIDILPPVFSYSLGNLLFAFLRLVIVIYAGVEYADKTLKKSALSGAALGFAVSSLTCIAGLLSIQYSSKPVLGISADTQESRFILLLFVIIENVILGGLAATLAAWVVRKKDKRPSRPSLQ
jgi:hypothetical protein